MLHFICDKYGHYWTGKTASECPVCGHEAVWEFDKKQPALDHSFGIRNLFTKARQSCVIEPVE